MQPKNLLKYDSVWTTNQRIKTYRQHLARRVLVGFSIDPVESFEPIIANMPIQYFSKKNFMEEKRRTIEEAKKNQTNFTLWCDGFKLNQ